MTLGNAKSRTYYILRQYSVVRALPSHQTLGPSPGCGEGQEPRYIMITVLHFAGELTWGVDETLAQLEMVLHLFRSGQYLQNSTSSSAGE